MNTSYKKIGALVLVLLVAVVPVTGYATSHESVSGSIGSIGAGTIESLLSGSLGGTFSTNSPGQFSNITGTLRCGGSATGSAGSNALLGSNIVQQLFGGLGAGGASSLITCISGQSCPGGISGAGSLGGGSLNSLLGLIRGGGGGTGQITQQIISLAGQTIGPKILSALGIGSSGGGAAGAAGSAVGSVLHSGAANSVGSLLGAGSFLGGGAVPVDDSVVRDNTAVIQQVQKNFETKEFCTDGIAYDLAQQAHGEWVSDTVKFANKQAIDNWQKFRNDVDEATFKKYVEGLEDQKLQELMVKVYQEERQSKVGDTNNPCNEESSLEFFRATFVDETCPTYLSEIPDALDEWKVRQSIAWDSVARAIQNNERSQVVCLDENGNETGESLLEQCGGNFRIVTDASVISNQRNEAVSAGPRRLAQVDESTKNVNQFMVQLFQQAFTNIGGLLSLSERGSAASAPPAGAGSQPATGTGTAVVIDEGGSAPSYLDQISGSGTETSLAGTKNLLTESINVSISTEEGYRRVLAGIVQDLSYSAGTFDQVRQCYVDLTKRISTGISTATALERANQASTTIASIFVPQIERRVGEIAESELVVGELVRIAGVARGATDIDSLNAASDAYDALLSAGLVHSENDIIFLENDRRAAAIALDAVSGEAAEQLAECRQF